MSAAEGSELSPRIAEKTCRGEFVFPDGSRFSGDYVLRNDIPVRHGKGKQISVAQEFEGEFVDDRMQGTGTLLFASGAKFEGSFAGNQFEGIGTYSWPDGAVYAGEWRAGRMHGKGTYKDGTGTVWSGEFQDGRYDTGKAFIDVRQSVGTNAAEASEH